MAEPGLTPDQLEAFERDGFVAGVEVLRQEEVAEFRSRLDSMLARLTELEPELHEVEAGWLERPGEVVAHFLGAWRIDDRLAALVRDPRITVPVAQALGVERLRFWHDQVFAKPAGHPGCVPWHQDYAYWQRTAPPCHATLFLTLDDMGPENGGLQLVPGSHRWPLQPPVAFDGPMDALREGLPAGLAASFQPRAIRLRAGQASLHHSHTVHGSFGNPSASPRRAVVLNYMGPETRVADGREPLLRGLPRLPTGALVDGDAFPIVLGETA